MRNLGIGFGMLGVLAVAFPTVASAEVWVARCNDLEFRFDRALKQASVSMVTGKKTFPLAAGKVRFDNGMALRAALAGLGDGPGMDIGLNRNRKIVYVYRKVAETGAQDDAVFCATDIVVE